MPSPALFARLLALSLFATATLGTSLPILAADGEAPQARPRIGLALSGGGARGAAHIGVLKVLESLRVPVDCITGTSMGSIIGGSYSAGTPTAELERVIAQTDWNDVFNDKPPRQEQAMRRKQEAFRGYSDIELGLKDGGIATAKGLISGVQVESFLRRLTRPVADVDDFSKLPIPFKAVATDIETGEAVILDHGSLPQAMRASMAIPGLMAPVELKGQLLVDGGIANNLPIDLARQTCADVIIAVNIQSPLYKRDQLKSALAITGQLINLLGKTTVDQQLATLKADDILISPELGDITSSSFDKQKEAILIGEQAARALEARLARYSLPEAEYQALRKKQIRVHNGMGKVDRIRFEGLERTNGQVLEDLMQSRAGEELTEDTLAADMRRIYGRGDFEGIDYRINQDGGVRTLLVSPREKSWGPDYLSFGFGIASDFTGDSNYELMLQHKKTWINSLGAEWTSEIQVGRRNRIATEFYQPLEESGRYFVAPYGSLENRKQNIYQDGNRVASYGIKEATLGLDLGLTLGTYGTLRAGPLWQHGNYDVDTGSPFLPSGGYDTSALRAILFIDQLDRAWLSTDGYALNLSALHGRQRQDGQQMDYNRLEGQGRLAFSRGSHVLGFNLQGGTDLGDGLPGQEMFQLGGPLRLSGYQISEFQGTRYGFARVEYRNRAIKLPSLLGAGVFFGGSLEAGRMDHLLGGNTSSGTLYSGSLFLAADTAVGPAYLGVGVSDQGKGNLFLILGAP